MEISPKISKSIKDKVNEIERYGDAISDDFIELINKSYEEGLSKGFLEGSNNSNIVSNKVGSWSQRN